MKTSKLFKSCVIGGNVLAVLAMVSLSGCIIEARPRPVYYYRTEPAPAPVAVQPSADTQLQQLVAPIALYPDPLLAVLLPAATFSTAPNDQIQQADAWVHANPNAPQDAIDAQPWDPSVRALVHYPTVLDYMNSDIPWTQSLGAAFANQQTDVFAAIQDLRAQAKAEGNLNDTPQMDVVADGSSIALVPTNPDVMYVPVYDPALVYYQPYPITFGVGFGVGVWLNYGFDWGHYGFFVGPWRGGWLYDRYGWHRDPHFGPAYYHAWARDGRWGPGPRPMVRFAVRGDMRGRAFHAAPVHNSAGHYGAHPADNRGGHDDHRDDHGH